LLEKERLSAGGTSVCENCRVAAGDLVEVVWDGDQQSKTLLESIIIDAPPELTNPTSLLDELVIPTNMDVESGGNAAVPIAVEREGAKRLRLSEVGPVEAPSVGSGGVAASSGESSAVGTGFVQELPPLPEPVKIGDIQVRGVRHRTSQQNAKDAEIYAALAVRRNEAQRAAAALEEAAAARALVAPAMHAPVTPVVHAWPEYTPDGVYFGSIGAASTKLLIDNTIKPLMGGGSRDPGGYVSEFRSLASERAGATVTTVRSMARGTEDAVSGSGTPLRPTSGSSCTTRIIPSTPPGTPVTVISGGASGTQARNSRISSVTEALSPGKRVAFGLQPILVVGSRSTTY